MGEGSDETARQQVASEPCGRGAIMANFRTRSRVPGAGHWLTAPEARVVTGRSLPRVAWRCVGALVDS